MFNEYQKLASENTHLKTQNHYLLKNQIGESHMQMGSHHGYGGGNRFGGGSDGTGGGPAGIDF